MSHDGHVTCRDLDKYSSSGQQPTIKLTKSRGLQGSAAMRPFWPERTGWRMRFDVVLSVQVFVWASVLAGCTGSPDMMLKKFGLVGTFSDDCSKAIEEGGARAIYEAPERGYPTFTAVNRFGTFQSKIERADYRVNSDTLIMYVVHPDGAWDEIDIQKDGTGFRTVKMVVHKRSDWRPSLTVDAGRVVGSSVVGSGSDGLLVAKCSD